ncbi:MAG: hypothetical protein BWY85_01781 [Firmicutes bacterium ADurb.Bin506]|nr:MAG: hypothetical protein BWY85_01781 [Firmicutes bacterium ADurb.Bin506]
MKKFTLVGLVAAAITLLMTVVAFADTFLMK